MAKNPYAYSDDPYSDFWSFEEGYNGNHYRKGWNPYASFPTAPANQPDPTKQAAPLPPGVVKLPDGTNGTPAPDPNAWTGADNQSWRNIDETTRQYYSDHPQEAWRQYIGDLVPGGTDSNFGRYALNHFGDAQAEYARAQEGHPDLQFTDTLTRDMLNKWRSQFGQQSTADQGQQWGPNVWGGRWVG